MVIIGLSGCCGVARGCHAKDLGIAYIIASSFLSEEEDEFAEEGMHYEGEHAEEGMHLDEEEDEMIEVDETTLVQELRRAKKLMAESARRKTRRINENSNIKRMIREELQDMLDLNITSQWVYGEDKPKRSKKGQLNHGSFMPGIGFKTFK